MKNKVSYLFLNGEKQVVEMYPDWCGIRIFSKRTDIAFFCFATLFYWFAFLDLQSFCELSLIVTGLWLFH